MISYIQVEEGPVDIHELRMKYLGKLVSGEGVMLPRFIHRGKTYFITDFKSVADDHWNLQISNDEGLVTHMRVKSGDLISNGSVLTMAEDKQTYSPKAYYDYWREREQKPAPFYYEGKEYVVKSFMRIPGSTELWITAERERGHWFTFQLTDELKSKFVVTLLTSKSGHQNHEWVLQNAKWTLDTIRYF